MMTSMRRDLPAGTVTFLFTDVEGSTRLLHELGAAGYAEALAEHRRILREAFAAHGGVEVDTQGDAFFVAFPTASGALAAADEARGRLAVGVRMGIHTGTPYLTEEGYVGVDVNRAARIAACGHGGQVLVSASTAALVGANGLRDLGEHRLKDLSAPERIFQFGDAGLPPAHQPASDESPGSRDTVPRTGERGLGVGCATPRRECPARDADRPRRQRQDTPRVAGGRRGRRLVRERRLVGAACCAARPGAGAGCRGAGSRRTGRVG